MGSKNKDQRLMPGQKHWLIAEQLLVQPEQPTILQPGQAPMPTDPYLVTRNNIVSVHPAVLVDDMMRRGYQYTILFAMEIPPSEMDVIRARVQLDAHANKAVADPALGATAGGEGGDQQPEEGAGSAEGGDGSGDEQAPSKILLTDG